MNRNTEVLFSNIPSLEIKRSGFDLSHTVTTTFDTGYIIPVGTPIEVLPGDTHDLSMSAVVRMTTPIFPIMDNAYIDYYAFFVPNRIVYEHWAEEMGENKQTAWEPQTTYTTPQIKAPSGGWAEGTIADYMGIPTKVANIYVSALQFRGYAEIYNYWFRDQTRKDPAMVHYDDTTRNGTNGTNYIQDIELGGMPAKAAKFHDMFTSTTPTPQRGPDVFIPLGGATGMAPVRTGDSNTFIKPTTTLRWYENYVTSTAANGQKYALMYRPYRDEGGDLNGFARARTESGSSGSGSQDKILAPANLWADLNFASGGTRTNSTINQLRQRFAVQSFYERLGSGGSRYKELILSMFGVSSPDARQDIPEYIGGERIGLVVNAVLQTSSTDSTSPQGNVAANSMTAFYDHNMGTYSATEHGFIHIVAVVRTDRTYQQGIDKSFLRKDMLDYFFPQFANVGDMPILNKEIYAQGSTVVDANGNIVDDQVFGYQAPWAQYTYMQNIVTGKMRSNATGTLDAWHYADNYSQLPIGVSGDWIDEPTANVARTLAVQNEPQFFGAFRIGDKSYRPIPTDRTPFNMVRI